MLNNLGSRLITYVNEVHACNQLDVKHKWALRWSSYFRNYLDHITYLFSIVLYYVTFSSKKEMHRALMLSPPSQLSSKSIDNKNSKLKPPTWVVVVEVDETKDACECCCTCGIGDEILHPSQSQIGGWVVKIPLVNKSFILFPQCRIDLFQSLAVSRPEMYWNSLGVIQASWNQMQGPLEPWQSLDRYIKAVLVPHSISSTTSSSRTCNEICLADAFWNSVVSLETNFEIFESIYLCCKW